MIEAQASASNAPCDELAPVQSTEEVADAVFITRLLSPTIAKQVEPGQFIQVRLRDEAVPLLRIPLSVAATDRTSGIIDVLYEAVGPKTSLLSRLRAAESLACLGPIGNSFPAPQPDQQVVLIGGGVGLPPLLFFGHALMNDRRAAGRHAAGRHVAGVDLFVGARTKAKHLGMERLRTAASSVAITTDDGSAGHAGLVTELLEQKLRSREDVVVYTCGPHPMMRAVAAICSRSGVSCFASLEEYMACGYGVCVGCVVETVPPHQDRSEYERYSRICVDGPVYDAAQISWD